MSRKLPKGKSLAEVNPGLANEWHPTKNGSVKAYDFLPNSHKKVWWKCGKEEDHEYESIISSRFIGSGCPICDGKKVIFSNCLATLNPGLAKEWHPTKNGDLTPFEVTLVSGKKVWWKCEHGEDHEWESTVANRAKGDRCTVCKNKKIVNSNCLAILNPGLAKEWHPTKNGDLTPFDVGLGSHKKVWWQCDKGDDHEWQSIVVSRSNGRGCPVCIGQKVVLSNCLATLNPNLAKEWHSTKNGSLTPFDVTIGTPKKAWWSCKKDDNHIWHTTISNRSREIGGNCPYCTLTPQSKQELTITFELIQFFKINPKGFKSRVQGKLWSIDIYIPEINLGIEFDGSYWHKNKRALDKLKTESLEDDGFKILRIREEPLKAITDIDIVSKMPFNAKIVANDILSHIMDTCALEAKRIKKIKGYLLKEEIQNEKGLEKYIDMILTEKADRKLIKN